MMEHDSIPVTSELKGEIEACLLDLNLSWEDFLHSSLQNFKRKKEMEQAIAELKEMERSGDYGKGCENYFHGEP